MLFFDAWSWHLGHLDSCQSLLERKKSSSLPLQTHGCLTSFKCHLHVDVIHSNYSPTVIFIWHCRQSLINLKLFSSTQLCNVKTFRVDRDNYCCIAHTSACVSSKIWSFHRLLGSNHTQTNFFSWSHFERVFIFPSSYWKTAGYCNKSVNFHSLLKFFPCALSPFVYGRCWQLSIFVYCNQSCTCLSKAFFCPYAGEPS